MNLFLLCLSKGQILANLKAMDSDYFAKNYMNRTEKVSGRYCAFTFLILKKFNQQRSSVHSLIN